MSQPVILHVDDSHRFSLRFHQRLQHVVSISAPESSSFPAVIFVGSKKKHNLSIPWRDRQIRGGDRFGLSIYLIFAQVIFLFKLYSLFSVLYHLQISRSHGGNTCANKKQLLTSPPKKKTGVAFFCCCWDEDSLHKDIHINQNGFPKNSHSPPLLEASQRPPFWSQGKEGKIWKISDFLSAIHQGITTYLSTKIWHHLLSFHSNTRQLRLYVSFLVSKN